MNLHRAAAVLLLLLVAACSDVRDTAGRAADCVGLARDVAASGLSRSPSVADAEAAARRLDERIQGIDDAELRSSTAQLRDRLQDLADASRAADEAGARAAAEQARSAARDTARLCGVPADQFLG
jgi:hypothetical protein